MRIGRSLVALAVVAGLAAGCGGSSHPGATPTTRRPSPTSAASAGTSTSTTPTTTGSTSTVTASPPGEPQCVTADLHGSFAVVPGSAGAGQVSARVVLTNATAATCVTGGYVGMLLLSATGAALPTNVVRVPGPTPTLHVAPGASVSAVARFSPDIPGPGDAQSGPCQPVAASTEITPPNDTAHLVVSGPGSSVCEQGTLQVSALQAGADAGPV